jgi:hypothetical protein
MRHPHSTITPASIHQEARDALKHSLGFHDFKQSVSVTQLLDLLLFMAASCSSLFATATRFFSFSHETASQAVRDNLPGLEELRDRLVQALFNVACFSRLDRRRAWMVAIDTNLVPFYGKPNSHVIGGPKKQGTKWFFGYATAVLLHQGRRFMIGLCPLKKGFKPHEIVQTLLDQIAGKGLKIKGVTLDSAFDSGDTIHLLQQRKLAYAVPLRRKGSGANARNRCFEGKHRSIRWTEWTTEKTRILVKTRVLLWKGRAKTMAFAFQGWSGDRAKNVHEQALKSHRLYRRRFGIETSYRQKNQAKAFTTSSDPVYRLLLEGVAYILRQVWVILTQVVSRVQGTAKTWLVLSFQRMIDWLVTDLAAMYQENHTIPLTSTS